jgi:hypothetical protein
VTPHLTQDASSQLSSGQTFQPPGPLTVPVLFLLFNRPNETFKVFEAIRRARPPRLYVAADGARPHPPDEAQKCEEVRKIVGWVDWPCQVKTLLREENLGCRRAVSSAINWFFDNEAEGVVLEDDCLPAQSFFWFCQELLSKYRADQRVWQICGTSMLEETLRDEAIGSYIFSKYGPIWGWATWRRAWSHYDANMADWLLMRGTPFLSSAYENNSERRFRLDLGNKLYRRQIDTWDYQWVFTKHYQSGLSIVPCNNMIVNIGFGPDATHTIGRHQFAPVSKGEIRFPLTHPQYVIANTPHDLVYREKVLLGSRLARAKRAVKSILINGYRFCVGTSAG